jgi:hypothetical protein
MAALVMLAIPVLAFLGGGWIVTKRSGREIVLEQIRKTNQKPLNQRLTYDKEAFRTYWSALDGAARQAEQRFLELDLVFPFLYGGALAASLLLAWAALGRPFNPAWLLAPVAITLLADWTENLVQFDQVHRYLAGGETALQADWVRIASIATTLKLLFFGGTSLFLVALVGRLLVRAFK